MAKFRRTLSRGRDRLGLRSALPSAACCTERMCSARRLQPQCNTRARPKVNVRTARRQRIHRPPGRIRETITSGLKIYIAVRENKEREKERKEGREREKERERREKENRRMSNTKSRNEEWTEGRKQRTMGSKAVNLIFYRWTFTNWNPTIGEQRVDSCSILRFNVGRLTLKSKLLDHRSRALHAW